MTKKIVISACYGGFSVSEEGMKRYAEIKGLTLYPKKNERFSFSSPTFWLMPPDQRMEVKDGPEWHELSLDERKAHNKAYEAQTLSNRDFKRDDPILVQVVEELGKKASGIHANLVIVEIDDDVGDNWHITKYDGFKGVAENHRTWG